MKRTERKKDRGETGAINSRTTERLEEEERKRGMKKEGSRGDRCAGLKRWSRRRRKNKTRLWDERVGGSSLQEVLEVTEVCLQSVCSALRGGGGSGSTGLLLSQV